MRDFEEVSYLPHIKYIGTIAEKNLGHNVSSENVFFGFIYRNYQGDIKKVLNSLSLGNRRITS